MKKTIWVSYDLGVKGDYTGMYRWLDNMQAAECGDNLAYMRVEVPNAAAIPEFLRKEIETNVEISKSDRIYVIWKHEDKVRGRFIFGNRKASPWVGYGDVMIVEDDD